MKKTVRGEFEYLKNKKRLLLLEFIGILILAVGIFMLGLVLNKWEKTNIFTVVSIVMVLPAAKIFVLMVVVFPFKSIDEKEKVFLEGLVGSSDLIFYNPVFTSSERHMHLDCIIVTEHQVIGYTTREKDDINKINEYFKKEFSARGVDYVSFITNSEKALNNRFKMRGETAPLTEKQQLDMEEVVSFIRTAIV